MKIVRFKDSNSGIRLGILNNDRVYDLTEATGGNITDLEGLWMVSNGDILSYLSKNIMLNIESILSYSYDELNIPPTDGARYLIKAVDSPEVWAAGVTYKRSRDAREFETRQKTIYDRVYEAERPELFFKATKSRHVGPYEEVGIRSDSKWNVPEPELGLVIGDCGQLIGFIIGNDMSSRDIEGENSLYLPQAKVYKKCCAIGPILALNHKDFNAGSLDINCRIVREGNVVYDDKTSTNQLIRPFEELIEYLMRDNVIPFGTILLTGTGLVPPAEFTLKHGDQIEISIDELGVLKNTVRQF